MQLRYTYRLNPTPAQRRALGRAFGCARVVFNDAVAARRAAHEAGAPFPTDGALSTAKALPAIALAVKGDLTIFADSGVRTGLDVVRLLALGADGVLIGRAFVYALATSGAAGVRNLLAILEKDIRTSMVLTGVQSVRAIDASCLA